MYIEELGIRICTKEDIEASVSPHGETSHKIKQVEDYLRRAGLR